MLIAREAAWLYGSAGFSVTRVSGFLSTLGRPSAGVAREDLHEPFPGPTFHVEGVLDFKITGAPRWCTDPNNGGEPARTDCSKGLGFTGIRGKILTRCRIGLPPFVEKVEGGRRATPAMEET